MKHSRIAILIVILVVSVLYVVSVTAYDGDDDKKFLKAKLVGLNEAPAVVTAGSGEFHGTVSQDENSIEYELSYSNLQGTVTQGHIHIAQKNVNGGIAVWLCGTDTNPGPQGTPRCPPSGTVNGTITAANIIGPSGQGINPTEFADFLKAIRNGVSYANVHSTQSPGGEIRGQIKFSHHQHKNDW